jgi:hypothetical protein
MDLRLNGQTAIVLILVSDRTANVTGADITIDGGLIPTW